MRTSLKITIASLLVLLAGFAAAQVSQPLPPQRMRILSTGQAQSDGAPTLPENYVLTLTITEKDVLVTELSLIVATPEFSTSFPDSRQNVTSFQGSLLTQEGGGLLVRYTLSGELPLPGANQTIQYKTYATASSVRLQPGDNVVVMKTETRTCRLALARAADTKGK